ncbi:type 11 methyltransferase [Candidatus Magnetobacterium bavaricum]|uniref:Type 11 methyltransferase n=1 Tax=Candidatus Magnetobacterium bavaricum TaxID=29290 RepID=A0A0F3GV60_9BACT|nr:type 11 methyltransferase [Candidatus Magnetobacterium bavaricum]
MSEGLRKSKTCAVFIGEKPPERWFKEEIQFALSRRVEDTSFGVIPVLLQNAKKDNVPDFLKSNSWIDFSKGVDFEYEMYRLVCGIKGIPPGRWSVKAKESNVCHNKLTELKDFVACGLITQEVYVEAQRKIIDRWIVL